MKLQVNVTQEVIDESLALLQTNVSTSQNCPISIAIKRVLPTTSERLRNLIVLTGTKDVLFMGPDGDLTGRYDLPGVAREFVYNFDRRDSGSCLYHPFSFELEIQDER